MKTAILLMAHGSGPQELESMLSAGALAGSILDLLSLFQWDRLPVLDVDGDLALPLVGLQGIDECYRHVNQLGRRVLFQGLLVPLGDEQAHARLPGLRIGQEEG